MLKNGSSLTIRDAILLACEGKASVYIALQDDEESMRAALPETTVTKTGVQQINVGEVKVGPISIARLVLSDLHVESSTGVARLRNVVTTITLQLSLDWKVGVTIDTPLGDVDFSRSGSVNLGLLEFSLGLGNIALPGFANLSFDIASLPVTNVAAVVGPIQNLNLGPAIAEQIRAANIGVPTAGFQLAGLQLSKLRVEGLKIPAADLGQATIDHIQGGALPLTNLKIPNLELPQARIPDLKSSNIDASSNPATKGLHADLGILEITLSVTTTARFQIDELRVENIKAASRIGAIELTDVVLPYEVFDLTLSQIGIETIEIPQLEVS